jgi:hypothetical protein
MKSNRSSIRWRHWLSLVAVFLMLLMLVTADVCAQDDGVPSALTRAPEATARKEQTSPQVTVVTSSTKEIVLEAGIPPVQFREVVENGIIYQRLSLPGTGTTTEIGKPELPTFGHFVAVPIGARLQVEILEETPLVALLAQQDAYRIYPAQQPQMDLGPEPPFELNAAFYKEDALYPPKTVAADEVTTLRGINVTVVRFFPVQFNPARGQLRVFSRLRVRISFSDSSERFVDQRLWSPYYENMYQQLLLNYSLLEAEVEQAAGATVSPPVALSANGAEFLIITNPSFIEQANTLADWRRLRGIDTEVRTTTQTGTTASAIRDYILNAYNNWNPPPSFVLLLGDAEFIPPHYVTVHPWACSGCWYPPGTLIGTDLYYADMTGNYYPELGIGRIPVDTVAEATTVVNKIVSYERTPPATTDFYSSAMVVAYFEDLDLDNYSDRCWVKTSEEIRDFLLTQAYSVNRVYYARPNVTPTHYNDGPYGDGEPLPAELLRPGFAWDGWKSDIQSAINAGRFLVTHRDHGLSLNNDNSPLEGWQYPRLTATDVTDLSNGSELPVVFSMNCETGWFDGETDCNDGRNTQSLSEVFLLHLGGGAVGVIGATRGSFSGYNDFMTRGFIDAIWPSFIPDWGSATPEYRMGQVLNLGKLSMVQFWGDPSGKQQVTFEDFHYFGDPTMEIWTAFPSALSVSHPATLAEGSTSLTVNVAQDGALVSLVQDGEIIATATSSGGHATLNFNPVSIGLIYVTVTNHNYVPYEGSVEVTHNDPPNIYYLPLILRNH